MRHRTVERIHKHHFSNVLAMYELNGIRMVRNDRTILSIDHLEIPTHELTLILGHNGSGKSTLASIISGLVKPDAGTTKLEGCDLFTLSERERAQRAAFLPQKLPASEGLTCRELVRLGRFPWRGLFGRWRAEDEAAVDEALAATGSAQYAQSYVDDLSGGERQRVWISMLLAQASPVMILDEPTSGVDPLTRREFWPNRLPRWTFVTNTGHWRFWSALIVKRGAALLRSFTTSIWHCGLLHISWL